MDREAALGDFEAARRGWEEAFARVPDAALSYLQPGDDYSLGGLQRHVDWVLVKYSRVLSALLAFRFQGVLGPQHPPEAEAQAREAARQGMRPDDRPQALAEMARLHEQVLRVCRSMPAEDWSRKAPVVYEAGHDPYPTSAEDIVGWLADHYREHVGQCAELIDSWKAAAPKPAG